MILACIALVVIAALVLWAFDWRWTNEDWRLDQDFERRGLVIGKRR